MSVSYSHYVSSLRENLSVLLFTACFYLKFAENYFITHKVKFYTHKESFILSNMILMLLFTG